MGHFQDRQYFENSSIILRDLLRVPPKYRLQVAEAVPEILLRNTVSMHVRRGDYVSLSNMYRLLEKDYYLESLTHIAQIDSLIIVSDDIDWCKKQFRDLRINVTIIFSPFGDELLDFVLLYMGRHIIIANSSFSWWAAFLKGLHGDRENAGVTLAPEEWYQKDGELSHLNRRSFFPESWTIINSIQRNLSAVHEHPMNITLVCWILTGDSAKDKGIVGTIENGWGKFCDHLEFIHRDTPGIEADWREGYDFIAGKSFRAWEFMHKKYFRGVEDGSIQPADFILKADTDTYVLGENLRSYIEKFNPEVPHYIGKQLISGESSIVAGAAIILSRAASTLFFQAAGEQKGLCSKKVFSSNPAEDVAMALCMRELGIFPQNTQDKSGRERFMVLDPDTMSNVSQGLPDWYLSMSINRESGSKCCSEEAIAFHKVTLEHHHNLFLAYDGKQWIWKNRTVTTEN